MGKRHTTDWQFKTGGDHDLQVLFKPRPIFDNADDPAEAECMLDEGQLSLQPGLVLFPFCRGH